MDKSLRGIKYPAQTLSQQSRKPSRMLFSGSPNSSRNAGLEQGTQPFKEHPTRLPGFL
jgi:hypothetical protein